MKANKIFLALLLLLCAVISRVILDKAGPAYTLEVELLPTAPDGTSVVLTEEVQNRVAEIFCKRLRQGVSKAASVKRETPNHLSIELPEEADLARAETMIKTTGRLEFREARHDTATAEMDWVTKLDGSSVENAAAFEDRGHWGVQIRLTAQGTKDFALLTQELAGKELGIFFDGVEISAPVVDSPIKSGYAVISGSFTEEEATEMANYLNAGSLPVKVRLVSSPAVTTAQPTAVPR